MVKNPETNFGFIIQTVDGNPSSLFTNNQDSYFHSSEAANASLTPRLIVTGATGTETKGGAVSAAEPRLRIQYLHNAVSIYFPGQTPFSVIVMDYKGRALFRSIIQGEPGWRRIPGSFAPGLYCITVRSAGVSLSRRVMVY